MTKVGFAIALLLAALSGCARGATAPPQEKPDLLLITALPIVNGESFAIDAKRSPALTRIEQDFRVRPIGVSDAASLRGAKLLLMAQPRAQPAEALVDLDDWVRAGGRVMILADPRLEWPSQRPLGDALRPPFDYPDTGLLKHWGLSLEANGDRGTLRADAGAPCRIASGGLAATCTIGKGRAEVIGDADQLNVAEPADLDLFVAELTRFGRHR